MEQLDDTTRTVGIGIVSAGGGYIVKSVVDWWLARGDKRLSREDAIAAANDALAEQLREELRKELKRRDDENQALRDRLSKVEGRADELSKANQVLLKENGEMQAKSGRESQRMNELVRVNADQALKLSALENELTIANDRIELLESALHKANIAIPEPTRRRSDTGPLSPAAA